MHFCTQDMCCAEGKLSSELYQENEFQLLTFLDEEAIDLAKHTASFYGGSNILPNSGKGFEQWVYR